MKAFWTFYCKIKHKEKMKVESNELLYSVYSYNHHPHKKMKL